MGDIMFLPFQKVPIAFITMRVLISAILVSACDKFIMIIGILYPAPGFSAPADAHS
jgi:hypothetical protein